MFDVVNAEDGTGRRAQLEGKNIYVKTGTALWKPQKFLAWSNGWTGDGKDSSQRYAITVLVENGQSSGEVATPLARMILADCLTLPKKAPGEKLKPERLEPAAGHTKPIEVLDEK